MSTHKKVLFALSVLLLLLWIPPTRYVIFWLLPVGSGIDDLIFVIICIAVFILAFVKGWVQLPKFFRNMEDNSDK